jgi:hypothetical protein
MVRRAVVAGALLLTFMVVVPVAAGAAVTHSNAKGSSVFPPITGTGITKCPIDDATIKFSPPLKTAGVATSETVTIKAAGKPCAGGTPVPHEYTLKAGATITGTAVNTCSDFFATSPPGTVTASGSFNGIVKYQTNIANSTISFPSLSSSDTTLTAPVSFTITPVAVTGSYPTASGVVKMKSETSEDVTALNASCATAAGLSKITMGHAGGVLL